jgi:hypothetical protein
MAGVVQGLTARRRRDPYDAARWWEDTRGWWTSPDGRLFRVTRSGWAVPFDVEVDESDDGDGVS